MEPIMGTPKSSREQAAQWAINKGAKRWWADLTSIYWRIGNQMGVRPDVGFAQACKETGFGYAHTGKDSVLNESYHNPCGLKIPAGGSNSDPNAHARFPDWDTGVRAHLEHLYLYAVGPVPNPVDPRHFAYLAGTAKHVEQLSTRWAPSKTYHQSILTSLKEIQATKEQEVTEDDDMAAAHIKEVEYLYRLWRKDPAAPDKDPGGMLFWISRIHAVGEQAVEECAGALAHEAGFRA